MNLRRLIGLGLISLALGTVGGCATKAAYNDVAQEQDRCAGYWRSTGDPDRASEMNRRAMESRRASADVGSWEDFFGEAFLVLLSGNRRPEPIKQPPHPNDPRGCQQ
jgi:hypothetical protein